MIRCRRCRTHGFTLIEVLAALVIVALGMLGAITAVNQATGTGTYLREKTLAHWIAMNVITERRLQQSPPELSESGDELEFAGQRWRWTMKVTQTAVDSLRRMDVSVRLAAAADGSSLATVSGFYGTAVGAAGGTAVTWGDGATPGGDGTDDGTDGGDGGDRRDRGNEGTQGNRPRPRPAPSDMKE